MGGLLALGRAVGDERSSATWQGLRCVMFLCSAEDHFSDRAMLTALNSSSRCPLRFFGQRRTALSMSPGTVRLQLRATLLAAVLNSVALEPCYCENLYLD